jgi:hypothetical protein
LQLPLSWLAKYESLNSDRESKLRHTKPGVHGSGVDIAVQPANEREAEVAWKCTVWGPIIVWFYNGKKNVSRLAGRVKRTVKLGEILQERRSGEYGVAEANPISS